MNYRPTKFYFEIDEATSMKLKESIGEWVDAIVGRDAYCSDKIVDEYCTKSDFSDKTSCIGGSGVWMSTYQGSANEDVCLMDREWEPEVPFKPARCSEPEWGTKEQCEQESTWVFPVEAKDAYCSDGYSITDEGCQANRKWYRTDIEAALDEPHYCILVDDSSNIIYDENDGTIIKDNRATTMEECEQGRNWFPAVEFKAGYCVDGVSEYSQCEFAGT